MFCCAQNAPSTGHILCRPDWLFLLAVPEQPQALMCTRAYAQCRFLVSLGIAVSTSLALVSNEQQWTMIFYGGLLVSRTSQSCIKVASYLCCAGIVQCGMHGLLVRDKQQNDVVVKDQAGVALLGAFKGLEVAHTNAVFPNAATLVANIYRHMQAPPSVLTSSILCRANDRSLVNDKVILLRTLADCQHLYLTGWQT